MLFIMLIFIGVSILGEYCESKRDPYESGSHWSYTIYCENGFVYKSMGSHRGTIQIFNSDNTPLRCGEKIH